MGALLLVPGVPAAAFFVIAVAFGLNPLRSAAWGAILGVVGFAGLIYWDQQQIAQRQHAAATVDCSGQFGDFILGCPAHRLVPVGGDPSAAPDTKNTAAGPKTPLEGPSQVPPASSRATEENSTAKGVY